MTSAPATDLRGSSAEPKRVSQLDGLGLEFAESMSGFLGVGEKDPKKGAETGRSAGTALRFDVQIRIADLGRFLRLPDHTAALSGTVQFPSLGGTFTICDGQFNLFIVDERTGMRLMTYRFRFTAGDGQTYYLYGHKEVQHDPGQVDVLEDMTRLFTTVHRGVDEHAPVYGSGELYFKLSDSPRLIASMRVLGAESLTQRVAALVAFTSFAYGALRDEYLKDLRPFYDTQYENLVMSGKLQRDGNEVPFFLVSGTHDKGFPWGDAESFSDVLLVVGDGQSGYERFCITDRVLESLVLDLTAGTYSYRGPLFALGDATGTSFSEIQTKAPHLSVREAEFTLEFAAAACDTIAVSFPLVPKLVRKMSSAMVNALRQALPGEHALGIHITPHRVTPRAGTLLLKRTGEDGTPIVEKWEVIPGKTFGEAERGAFRNLKEPTLLYGYLCAVRPEQGAARVQIFSRTLRDEREYWAKDRLDAFLGSVVSRTSSSEILLEGKHLKVSPLPPAGIPSQRAIPLRKTGEPILEVNNDQFPTAVFQRRIVEVQEPSGGRCLALEEDMSLMRLEAIDSKLEVKVASIRDAEKFAALDKVLEATSFDAVVDEKLAASGKQRAQFAIAIKPNFMFAYDKRDHSTYTDPELVGHLAKRLRQRGFEKVFVVEAQSTYGEFFDKRSVREVAEYLGFDEDAGYTVVDMTEDAVEQMHLGTHLGLHPVSRVWRDADFRISFAKNKTHAYAFYTLTLKNIYGALPLANKFKEYHCRRDIYHTTLEYLTAFPVHYGLVDAFLSADGPFGIFADPKPNDTQTVIGGADLVAVDWVAASKMGIDPLISPYMKLAVKAFGKPEIHLVGDSNPYRPWLNVPVALTLFTHKGVDADFHFGNLLYTASAQMDETHFRHKSRAWHIRVLRWFTVPLRRTFFLRTGENPSIGNRIASWVLYRMGF